MYRTISKVRQKPESVRRRLAAGITAGLTLTIATIWLVTVPGRLNTASSQAVIIDQQAITRQNSTVIESNNPVTVLSDSLANSFDYVWRRTTASVGMLFDKDSTRIEQPDNNEFKADFLPENQLDFLP